MEKGLVQVYTGAGKGKTTAAIGLVVRTLGWGMRVLLVRFFKPAGPESGEVVFLQGMEGLEILSSGIGIIGGVRDREAVGRSIRETFALASGKARSGAFDLVILDEINNVLHRGYLPLAEVLSLLDGKPPGVELVLTGRNAPAEVLERAHLVTRMDPLKHPLELGIAARRGIEY